MNFLRFTASCFTIICLISCTTVKQNELPENTKQLSQIESSQAASPSSVKDAVPAAGTAAKDPAQVPAQAPVPAAAPETHAISEQTASIPAAAPLPIISYSMRVLNSADIPTAGRKFTKPYVVQILFSSDDKPAEGVEVICSYPSSRTENGFAYNETSLKTDEKGTISFLPPSSEFACSAEITFKTVQDSTHEAKEITAPYQVKTSRTASGGSIALVDFDKSGKPITNNSFSSSAVLTMLIRTGFSNIGNSDFTQQIISGSDAAVAKAAKQLFGNHTYFMVYGTVKYDGMPEKIEKGYAVKLTADVVCRNMIAEKVVFKQTISAFGEGSTEYEALNSARRVSLAQQLADLIRYSL